jgi:hypothetical protein
MQISKKSILIIFTFILVVVIFITIFFAPIKKEELKGEYLEIFSGGFWGIIHPTQCCTYMTIDDKKFCTFPGTLRSSEYAYNYMLDGNVLSYDQAGYEKVIRHWFSDKVEGTGMVEYRAIKLGTKVILLGGDYNRILVKIDRKAKINPGSKKN